MKKFLISAALCMMISSLASQTKLSEHFTTYELDNSTLHLFQSGDPMGNVSIIVEGSKGLVVLEQPMFWSAINEFNDYIKALDKPIDKVVANYHSLGLADYPSSKVVMPEAMVKFSASDKAQGMIAKFEKNFGEAADFRPYKKAKGFKIPSEQQWAGVKMSFSEGPKGDFPAASIHIDGKGYYAHFAPSMAHASRMVIRSRESLASTLEEMKRIEASGAEYIFGSHGAPATLAEVRFQIEYLTKVSALLQECDNSDIFGQKLMVAYPTLAAPENIKPLAQALYPDEVKDPIKEQVRGRMNDYLSMVSNLDMEIAEGLWAKSDGISIITPRTQFFGYDSIMNDFLIKAFSSFQDRKLSSLSEVINVYGDSANVQLYWKFDTVNAEGVKGSGRGRESLIFEKIDGQWRLVHVHYSPLPQK